MKAIKFYIWLAGKISEYTGRLVSVLIPAMVVILMIEVVARYFFKQPTLWAYDTSIFMYGYCGVIAGAYTLKHRGHIIVDVVYSTFKPRTKAVLNVLTGLLFFFFLVVFIKYTWNAALIALEGGHRSSTQWAPPIGHYRLILPIGGTLLLMQGLANWLEDLYQAVTGKALNPGAPEEG